MGISKLSFMSTKPQNDTLEILQKMPKSMENDLWLRTIKSPILAEAYKSMTLEDIFGAKTAKVMRRIAKAIDLKKATADQFCLSWGYNEIETDQFLHKLGV